MAQSRHSHHSQRSHEAQCCAHQTQSQAMMSDEDHEREQVQEVYTAVLTKQIAGTFNSLTSIAAKIKGGRLSQDELTSENEMAIALLSMLGANCQDLARQKHHDVLVVGYEHFVSLRRGLDQDSAFILKDWLSYIDAALLSKPLTKLQITRRTLERSEANMVKSGGLLDFFGKFLGAKHDTQEFAQQACDNADQLRAQNAEAIKRTKARYERLQRDNRRCPTQNEMYRVSGGTADKELAPALQSERTKLDARQAMGAKRARPSAAPSQGNAYIVRKPIQQLQRHGQRVSIKFPYPCRVLKQRDDGMADVVLAAPLSDVRARVALSNLECRPHKVHAVEQQHLAQSHCRALGYASLPMQSNGNAYIATEPARTLLRNKQPVKLEFPYPCQVLRTLEPGVVGVMLAYPNNDMMVRVQASNLETDFRKVAQVEHQHMARMDGKGLGYAGLHQIAFQ